MNIISKLRFFLTGEKRPEDMGYQVIEASQFEVGLTKNGKGIKTWWIADFNGKLPALDHPKIKDAIQVNEQMESWRRSGYIK
jgi:hypothetical protein